MPISPSRLALHTWTLDSTLLAAALQAARQAGWQAIELRRVDFQRAFEAGQSAQDVIDLVRASGLRVAATGVEAGWVFATGAEQQRLFGVIDETCRAARELGCGIIMSAVGEGRGSLRQAADSLRATGDLVARFGLRLAFEFNSQGEQINTLERAREVLAAANHPSCGLLLDAYHLHRSGRPGRGFADLPPDEIFYIQYSDVPASGLQPGFALDRLPPGQGQGQLLEFFGLLDELGYRGDLSYEAPNSAAWARDPLEVAAEALAATCALLPTA